MFEWSIDTSSVSGNNDFSLGYSDCKHHPRRRVSQANAHIAWRTLPRNDWQNDTRRAADPRVVFSQLTLVLIAYNTWRRGFCKIIADSVGRPSRPLTAEYLERSLLDSVAENIPKHTKLQERLFEIVGRLGALFGSGWFFEWPGGKRPLNSTWPWADVKPSLLVLWGVCWMFVIAHPYNIGGRGYSPGNSLSRNQNGAGSRGRPQQRSADNYYLTPPAQTQSPVVKRENLGHSHTLRGDWPLFQQTVDSLNIDEAAYLYSTSTSTSTSHSAPPQQPIIPIPVMMQAPDQRPYHQAGQADTTAPLTAMRNSRSTRIVTTLSPAQGILHEFPDGNAHTNHHSNTNTNANDARRVAESLNATQTHSQNYGQPSALLRYHESPNPNAVKRGHTATPENSGEVLGQQHNQAFQNLQHQRQQQQQQRPYYESSRHDNTKPFLRSTASTSSHFTNTSYLPSFPSNDTMSIAAYESAHRPFNGYPTMPSMHDDQQEQDDNNMQHRYPSPGAGLSGHPYNDPVVDQTADSIALELQQELPQQKDESLPPSPGRMRPIPKPDREVTKTEEGKYICMWQGCTEEQRLFNRKCEWSKHMDKHDRPYKCPSEGCEKLPGFTYSGGLLRHQREVHNLHGGPRKQLNCHYPNCKRHNGKGFSRQENLNEHLRRVHTAPAGEHPPDETEDDSSEGRPWKRKRGNTGSGDSDVRVELSKLRLENDELRRNSEIQSRQVALLSQQVQALEDVINGRVNVNAGAPQAMM